MRRSRVWACLALLLALHHLIGLAAGSQAWHGGRRLLRTKLPAGEAIATAAAAAAQRVYFAALVPPIGRPRPTFQGSPMPVPPSEGQQGPDSQQPSPVARPALPPPALSPQPQQQPAPKLPPFQAPVVNVPSPSPSPAIIHSPQPATSPARVPEAKPIPSPDMPSPSPSQESPSPAQPSPSPTQPSPSPTQPSPPPTQPSPSPTQQSPAQPSFPPPSAPVLLWADEFDGSQLDGSKWEAMLADGTQFGLPPGWGNNELEWYTGRSENVRVENGALVLQAQAEPAGSEFGNYTSGRIRTSGRFAIAPSDAYPVIRIEARIQLDAGQGLWPAFWMLPEEWAYGGWSASGEIDIMEACNAMDWCVGSLHYGGVGQHVMLTNGTSGALSVGWHTYALEWELDHLRWYLDGRQYLSAHSNSTGSGGWYSTGSSGTSMGPHAPFDRPFHILLNLAVGGNYPNVSPQAVAATLASGPKQLVVDYVRVWGREQQGSPP